MSQVCFRIMCAACRRPVDRVEWWDSMTDRVRVIQVSCHGETDRMEMTDDFLFALTAAGKPPILEGEAFVAKPLLSQAAPCVPEHPGGVL